MRLDIPAHIAFRKHDIGTSALAEHPAILNQLRLPLGNPYLSSHHILSLKQAKFAIVHLLQTASVGMQFDGHAVKGAAPLWNDAYIGGCGFRRVRLRTVEAHREVARIPDPDFAGLVLYIRLHFGRLTRAKCSAGSAEFFLVTEKYSRDH